MRLSLSHQNRYPQKHHLGHPPFSSWFPFGVERAAPRPNRMQQMRPPQLLGPARPAARMCPPPRHYDDDPYGALARLESLLRTCSQPTCNTIPAQLSSGAGQQVSLHGAARFASGSSPKRACMDSVSLEHLLLAKPRRRFVYASFRVREEGSWVLGLVHPQHL